MYNKRIKKHGRICKDCTIDKTTLNVKQKAYDKYVNDFNKNIRYIR